MMQGTEVVSLQGREGTSLEMLSHAWLGHDQGKGTQPVPLNEWESIPMGYL